VLKDIFTILYIPCQTASKGWSSLGGWARDQQLITIKKYLVMKCYRGLWIWLLAFQEELCPMVLVTCTVN